MSEATLITRNIVRGLLTRDLMNYGECSDIDTCRATGTYVVNNTTQNVPAGAYQYGILLVFALNDSQYAQIYMTHRDNVFVRVCWVTLGPWRKMTWSYPS